MSAALIGVTTTRQTNTSGLAILGVMQAYTEALYRAGACPLLIPLGIPQNRLDDLVRRLDGILLPGGGDIDPAYYGSQPHPSLSSIIPDRDELEIELVRRAVEQGIPFLGICRGLQVINVALGGSLYEDLSDQHPGAIKHNYTKGYARNYLAHLVEVQAGTLLAQALGANQAMVNSIHHQGIRELAGNLTASAIAPDGVIEAIELNGHPFGLGVQWHPECLPEDPSMSSLFRQFVVSAEARHAG